jgi:hypothetical protein
MRKVQYSSHREDHADFATPGQHMPSPTILDRHPDWQVRTAPIHFDKEQLAHFIGSNGGVEKKAKGKYPEVLNPQNPSVVPALQNGCDIQQENVYSSPIVITHEGVALAWMDPKAAKRRADQGYR